MGGQRINEVFDAEIRNLNGKTLEECRARFKSNINDRLYFAYEAEQRKDYVEAYRRLLDMTLDELYLLKENLEELTKPIVYPIDVPLKEKAWKSKIFSEFYVYNGLGEEVLYRKEYQFTYNDGKKYVVLIDVKEEDHKENPQCYIWEYIEAKDPSEDKLVKVAEPALVEELERHAERLMMGLPEDD